MTTQAAAAIKPPSASKCRCTGYKPARATDWLCSSVASCPAAATAAAGQCAPEYPGTRRCWLRQNWAKVMEAQGLGAGVDALVLGAGDRTVQLNLAALECACERWSLQGKTVAIKAAP